MLKPIGLNGARWVVDIEQGGICAWVAAKAVAELELSWDTKAVVQ